MIKFTLPRLLKARKAGKKIYVPIVLSLVDHTRFWEKYRWPVIRIRSFVDQNFMALTGLDVLVVHLDYRQDEMISLIESIMRFNPRNLETWDLREDYSISVISDNRLFMHHVPKPTILLDANNAQN